jgi:cobalt-zinc-cadmium efflux system outer membrane protein
MAFVPTELFPMCRGLRVARAARGYLHAALWLIVAGMPAPALPADSSTPAEPRSAVRTTTPLRELVTEALQNNPEIQAAHREREAAQHRITPAGALEDPMLEAGVINLPVPSGSFRREDMTMKMLGLSQKLPYPGKRGLRQDVAAKEAELVDYGYRETVNRVTRDVKIAYFDLAFVAESIRLVTQNKLVLDQFLQIAESRYTVGQGTQADVLKAQTQLSKMVDELIRLARERPSVEAELARALGRRSTVIALDSAQVPELRAVALDFGTLRDAAVKNRPQLLGLQSAIERAGKTLELARKDYYPDFDVRFAYGQRDPTLMGDRRDDMVSLTLAINLPVWRDTKLGPRVIEAVAIREQALEMYRAQENELTSKLRQQIAMGEQSAKSYGLYASTILPQARLTVEATLSAYRVNRADFLTLLDSQMTVFNYEISLAQAAVNFQKASAEIDLLTGKSSD